MKRKRLDFPIAALLLNIIPFVLFLGHPDVFVLVFISVFPIAGVIVGIAALCKGKEHVGKAGMIISAIAVAWPLVFIVTTSFLSGTGALTMNM